MLHEGLREAFEFAASTCFLVLTLITTIIFLMCSVRINNKAFRAGSLVSLNALLLTLLGLLMIVSTQMMKIIPVEILEKLYQSTKLILLSTIPLFLLNFFYPKEKIGLFFKIVIYIGLFFATLGIFLIFFDQTLLATWISSIGLKTLGNKIQPFFANSGIIKITNTMLFLFSLTLIVLSIAILRKKKDEKSGIIIIAGLVLLCFAIMDDLQRIYTGSYWYLDKIKTVRFFPGIVIMSILFCWATFKKSFYVKNSPQNEMFDYEKIVEVADEMLFILSEDLDIITANDRAKAVFSSDGKPINFIKILYFEEIEKGKDRQFWKERLLRLYKNGGKLSFNVHIKNGITSMPSEYHFRFDSYAEGKEHRLIGRAWPVAKYKLAKFIDIERLSLTIDNDIALASSVAEKLTATLWEDLEERDILMLRIGLYEMISNAIQHGNLGITSKNKTRAEESGYLFDFINDKQKIQKYQNKKVLIDYYYDNEKVVYRITDMGNGFDYESTLRDIENGDYRQAWVKQSGILMAISAFDNVEYNETGNQVLLTKNF